MHNIFFPKVAWDLKIPNHCNYFSKKKHILSQLSLERLKNTPVFLILKKESWFSIFIQKEERRYRKLPGIETLKKVVRQVTLPPKLSNWIPIFSQIWFTNVLAAALIKVNFRMTWNMLILFQYIRKIINAKKKPIDLWGSFQTSLNFMKS